MRWRRWVILAMLLSLHAGLIAEPGGYFQRSWLMVHFGLFLLWQPFVSTDSELNVFATILFFVITGVVIYSLSGWMMMTWVAILIGIMGGKVFTLQAARRGRFYLVAVFYLFTILLLWAVPVLLLEISALPAGLAAMVKILLPLALLIMAVLPYRAEDETTVQVFDFFYSLFIFQLVVVLVLGSIAAMRVTDNSYFRAVLLTVMSFSGALLLLAALWGPRAGYFHPGPPSRRARLHRTNPGTEPHHPQSSALRCRNTNAGKNDAAHVAWRWQGSQSLPCHR